MISLTKRPYVTFKLWSARHSVMMPTCLLNFLFLTHIEFTVCVAAVEENDNEVITFFAFIPANSCEYEDTYSNCASLKETWTCASDFVKTNCKAACNCQGKIY